MCIILQSIFRGVCFWAFFCLMTRKASYFIEIIHIAISIKLYFFKLLQLKSLNQPWAEKYDCVTCLQVEKNEVACFSCQDLHTNSSVPYGIVALAAVGWHWGCPSFSLYDH